MHNWHQLCYQDMLQINSFQKPSKKMTYLKKAQEEVKNRLVPVSGDYSRGN